MGAEKVAELEYELKGILLEVHRLSELDEPTGEEIERAERLRERGSELMGELRRARVEHGRQVARGGGNTESGDGARRARSPELMRQSDPYDMDSLELVRSMRADPVDTIARAKTAIERAPEHLDDKGREAATAMLESGGEGFQAHLARHMLLTGSPEYHEAFRAYAAGRIHLLEDRQRRALAMLEATDISRTFMSLTDGNGGFLVPFTLDPTIILTNSSVASTIRSLARVERTASDQWSGVTSAGVTAEWTAEGATWADASPSFGQPTITPKKADAWVAGSYEVLSDSGFESQLARLLADAKVRLEETAFATGNTGATIPRGVVAAVLAVTGSIVTSVSTGSFVIADVYNVDNAVTPRGEENQIWLANKSIYNVVRQFDTSGGGGFWSDLAGGQPPKLLGSPAYRCSPMTGTVATGTNILLSGNVREAYLIVDRIGMTVVKVDAIMSTGVQRPTGQAGFAAYWRVGADVVNVDALRVLQLNKVAAAVPAG